MTRSGFSSGKPSNDLRGCDIAAPTREQQFGRLERLDIVIKHENFQLIEKIGLCSCAVSFLFALAASATSNPTISKIVILSGSDFHPERQSHFARHAPDDGKSQPQSRSGCIPHSGRIQPLKLRKNTMLVCPVYSRAIVSNDQRYFPAAPPAPRPTPAFPVHG